VIPRKIEIKTLLNTPGEGSQTVGEEPGEETIIKKNPVKD
jgi:hypothetical protein